MTQFQNLLCHQYENENNDRSTMIAIVHCLVGISLYRRLIVKQLYKHFLMDLPEQGGGGSLIKELLVKNRIALLVLDVFIQIDTIIHIPSSFSFGGNIWSVSKSNRSNKNTKQLESFTTEWRMFHWLHVLVNWLLWNIHRNVQWLIAGNRENRWTCYFDQKE